MRKLFFVLALCPILALSQDRIKPICKTSRLGPMSVAITCLNGADPTGTKIGKTVVISCGTE